LLVAVAALLYSVWAGRQQQEHDRLMVKPILTFYRQVASDKPAGVYVGNNGLGVAEVVELRIGYRGRVYNMCEVESMRSFAAVLLQQTGLNLAMGHMDLPHHIMPAEGRLEIVGTTRDSAYARTAFKEIACFAKYKSIYGEIHTASLLPWDPATPNPLDSTRK